MHEIYERVLRMTQADPRRTLFIDDRVQNLAPAATLGMRTIQFQSADSCVMTFGVYDLLP